MSQEKPKYVRKKCEHNKYSFQCKMCKGSQICEHNRQKSICKLCKGSQICEHNSIKQYCIKCKGVSICEHNKRRSRCILCKGSQICEHNHIKSRCISCKGNEICEHNTRKETCIICKGSQVCEHNTRKDRCKKCKGSQVCEHMRIRSECKDCFGTSICKHNKHKRYCKECGGSSLCKSEWCEITANPKYDGYCLNCFIHLFPDKPNSRNYKTKENAVTDFILKEFPLEKYTWVIDKKIQDGCSRRRPDLLLDLGYQIIIIEIDENQHELYECSCENKRLMELSQDVGHRSIVFIRFNPDDYITKSGKVTSCWGCNKKGICVVKKTKVEEWDNRLNLLKGQIEYWCQAENITHKTLEIIQLFYDE